MRFRRLELVRYGAFADRVFDFGERGVTTDLHLVVGPNEAGKSTALQAIGDLLFGIPSQTGQNWRFDYGQLRLRALIEADGQLLDVTRRKGNRDTLLRADGTPFADDPLSPLLANVDRAAFERMFGLDHAKLRVGGEGILHNREDAARITLEAGTGMSSIGRELAKLTGTAAELFKPGGQNPPVNRLMRERLDALAEVRRSSITDTDWAQARQRRTQAQERRTALIDEAAELDREQARLDRLARARKPLAILLHARAEMREIGPLPTIPLDAADRLTKARAERSTALELEAQTRAELVRVEKAIAGVEAPGDILGLRVAIEALDERRPVIAKALLDLERRRAELERIDARLAAARLEAQIPEGVAMPTAGWRRRVASHLEAGRDIAAREQAVQREAAKQQRARSTAVDALEALGVEVSADALVAAIAELPIDASERVAASEQEAARRERQAGDAITGLAPWRGTFSALRDLDLPTSEEAAEARRSLDLAGAEREAARKEAEAAEAGLIRDRARLAGLLAGETLPTPEAVHAARNDRNVLLGEVRKRLGMERRSDDEEAGRSLADAIGQADRLTDRREAEATRVAEHALLAATIDAGVGLAQAARAKEAARRDEGARVEEVWARRLLALGFQRATLPADWAAWLTQRSSTLDAHREQQSATAVLNDLRERLVSIRRAIAEALGRAGGGEFDPTDNRLFTAARDHAARLSDATAQRRRLRQDIASLDESFATSASAGEQLASDRVAADSERSRLATEAGLLGSASDVALVDVLEAVGQVADDLPLRDGVARQIEGIERDRATFDRDVGDALQELGRGATANPIDDLRALGAELGDAIKRQDMLALQSAERDRLARELQRIERRLGVARAEIEGLAESAGVTQEVDIDGVITNSERAASLRIVERDAMSELADADNGAGLDALSAELAAFTAEDEAAARARVEGRRHELATEREDVGRALAASEDEARRAADESAAADAQQQATETTAALAQAAEDHVQAAAAAALLRWVLDRHRATNQAPLIARAGALFASVTADKFSGLRIGYSDDDKAVIEAVRADGAGVGVEALSEGTRDQLYLALRLGSIGGRSATLPIICDDLLITADDVRAAALLKVLAAAATHSQVIIFSHHEHLIDVARGALGANGFALHRIEPVSSAVAA